jgi:hypothetical protein
MKVFTFGRAVRLAMLGGAIYYVRKHGGVKSTWNELVEKMKPLADQAREKVAQVTDEVAQKGEKLSSKVRRAGEEAEAEIETRESSAKEPQFGSTTTGGGTGIPDLGNRGGFGDKTGY